jgi:pepF/M3 family oligoendopeptidase
MKTDVEALPHWDLTNVYPSLTSVEFQNDIQTLLQQLDEFDSFLSDHGIGKEAKQESADIEQLAETIGDLLARYNQILSLAETLWSYVYSFTTTDSYDAEAKKAIAKIEKIYVQVEKQEVLIRGWLGLLQDLLPEIITKNETAKSHAFYLQEAVQQSRYLMSEAEEVLASELALSGANAWSRLQGTVSSQIEVDFELDGELQKLPITAIINLHGHSDPDVRKRAYLKEMHVWESVKEPFAAALNGVKGTVITLDRKRGREDSLHSSLDLARIDRETLEAMLNAMKNSFPIFRRYLNKKAQRLGNESLPWWDLFAPVGGAQKNYSYEEACEFILEQFLGFSPKLADFAKRAFNNQWIDAEPRNGKRGGAFCIDLPKVKESRVLCNFDGTFDQMTTIAHELGHAFHNEFLFEKTRLQSITPMTMAETASIMCETIVFEAAVNQTDTLEEELAILESSLINDTQVIVDIYSRYLFEKEVFDKRAETELTADEFSEIMEKAQIATYGEGLDKRYLHKYMWTWKPHYYRPALSYYNYPYAFGLLFGIGLFAIYQKRGQDFVPDYFNLLGSTGLGNAAELAGRFHIDLREPSFWEDSLRVIEKRIDRYVAL